MKTNIYYVFLLAVLILASCGSDRAGIIEKSKKNIESETYQITVNKHSYIRIGVGDYTHSGDCAQCKYELDSIVKNAVNEAIEANNTEYWNE